jgi:histidine ammonia-lyase
MAASILLDGSSLTIEQVVQVSRMFTPVEISESAIQAVTKARESVERILKSGATAYGVNTGFGILADSRIRDKELNQLQSNLIRSHAVGTGEPIGEHDARALMLVRLNSLLRGYSGVRIDVIRILQEFLNKKIYPHIPRYGSLGASGDLAPSAHLGLCLIGEGFVFDEEGSKVKTIKVLSSKKIRPISLKAKEGLSIINGTQLMTATGSLLAWDASRLLLDLDVAAAMSIEALGGSLSPFDPQIQNLRLLHGQAHVAARILELLRDSRMAGTSKHVQDPYSLRCVPQVHGAFYDALEFIRKTLEVELNSVTDNPIILPEKDEVVSAGNFHGQPIALALDLLSIVLAEASVISERRIDKLLSGFNAKLPLFLTESPGLNSGLMVTQYTAAALVAENRVLATPAGLSNASVSAGQEDHASMGVTAALKARKALEHTTKVVAIEMLCASQALDFALTERKSKGTELMGRGTQIALKEIRKLSPRVTSDRSLHGDLEIVAKALAEGRISNEVKRNLQL